MRKDNNFYTISITLFFLTILFFVSPHLFAHGIRENRENAQFYFNRGVEYAEQGEYDTALEDYSRAILLDPNNAEFYDYRGYIYFIKGEYDLAVEDISRAILLDPNNADLYIYRGISYVRMGKNDQAVEDSSYAVMLDPNDKNSYNVRGIAYINKGEYDLAIADYNNAIALDPNYATAYSHRGSAYARKGDYDMAVHDFSRAILLDPNDPSFYNNRASVYMDKGKDDLALEDFSSAIMLGPDEAIFYNNRASFYLGKGDYDQAVKDYNESLNLAESAVDLTEIFTFSTSYANMIYEKCPYLQIQTEDDVFVKTFYVLAMDGISRSIKRAEQMRGTLGSQALYFYYMGVDFEVKFGSIEKAFEYSELLRSPVPANLAQTQQRLSADTAVMIYTIWDESVDFNPVRGPFFGVEGLNRPAVNSYCLVLTKDGLTAVTLDRGFNWQAIRRLRINVTEGDRYGLYNALVKPVLAHIPDNIQNLIIVPDSALEHLPFDILRENNDSPVLGEKYRLSVSPSVSGLVSYIREVKIDLRAVPQDAWQEGGKG